MHGAEWETALRDAKGRPVVLGMRGDAWDGAALTVLTERIEHDVEWSDEHAAHQVIINLGGTTTRLEARLSGGGRYVGPPTLGDLSVIPAGERFGGVYRGTVARFGVAYVPAAALEGAPLRGRVAVRDAALFAAVRRLDALIGRTDPHARLAGDEVARTLAARLRAAYGADPAPPPRPGRLAPRMLGALQDVVNDRLAEPIRLAELADFAGMPVKPFVAAFRASFGTTPARFVAAERVRRAVWLLAHSDRPVARVAYETGFSSQAHLTTVFRAAEGVTPAAYRRLRNGEASPR